MRYPEDPGFVRGSDTSFEAAEGIAEATNRMRFKVFQYIEQSGGATCDECEEALSMRHQTASARVRELVLKGQLTDTGERRQTRSGRRAVVWGVIEAEAA